MRTDSLGEPTMNQAVTEKQNVLRISIIRTGFGELLLAPMMKLFVISCTLMLLSCEAVADWGITGVAIRCDQKARTFTVAPVVELSSPDPGEVPVEPGFKRLRKGIHKLTCNLGQSHVKTEIAVFGPSDKGMSMGAGYVEIRSMEFGDTKLFSGVQPFNWDGANPILIKATISATNSGPISTVLCWADGWEWGEGFKGVRCDQKTLR